jgi:hypothetical protein
MMSERAVEGSKKLTFHRSVMEEKKLFDHCAGSDTDLIGQILDTYSSHPYVECQGFLNEDLWSLVSSLLTLHHLPTQRGPKARGLALIGVWSCSA